MGVVYVGVICISKHLKEMLVCATDEQFQVISNKQNRYTTKELKIKPFYKQYCMCCFVALSNVF